MHMNCLFLSLGRTESEQRESIRDATAEPTTNIAEDHDDVPQAADLIEQASETVLNLDLERTFQSDQAYLTD